MAASRTLLIAVRWVRRLCFGSCVRSKAVSCSIREPSPSESGSTESTDQLLMRAAHASDEVARILERLPPATSVVSLAEQVPEEASPTAGEIMAELDEPRTLDELLDRVGASDFEILEAVEELIDKNALVLRSRPEERVSIGDEEETLALRAAAARLHRRGLRGPLRIAVLTESPVEAEQLFRALGPDQAVRGR